MRDWLAVEDTPRSMVNTPAHFLYAKITADTARLLKLPDEAAEFDLKAEKIRVNYNSAFLDPATGIYGMAGVPVKHGNARVYKKLEDLHQIWWTGDRACTQAGQILPLALGMVPPESQKVVEAALLKEVQAHKGNLSTGFVSTPFLLDVLEELDSEAAWKMVAKQDYPSWYSMTKGSGNDLLMENWGGGQAIMPSCGGIIGNWCYAKLGGIRPDPSGPGFKKILIKPAVVSGVDWVECSHDSPYGKIISNWRRTGGELVMDVTIPPNTTARVVVPGQSKPEITADGRPLPAETLLKCLEASAKVTAWSVPAGHFRFTVSNVAN